MKKFYQIIILIFFIININGNITFCETNQESLETNQESLEKPINQKIIIIISSLILLSLLLTFLFLSTENLNSNIDELYKISVEISNNCTVIGWETIHQVLKDISYKVVDEENPHQVLNLINYESLNKDKLIEILDNLIALDKQIPNRFSFNSYFFEKSIRKLIEFLKNL